MQNAPKVDRLVPSGPFQSFDQQGLSKTVGRHNWVLSSGQPTTKLDDETVVALFSCVKEFGVYKSEGRFQVEQEQERWEETKRMLWLQTQEKCSPLCSGEPHTNHSFMFRHFGTWIEFISCPLTESSTLMEMDPCLAQSLAIWCDPLVSSCRITILKNPNPRIAIHKNLKDCNPQKSQSGMFPTDDEVYDLLQHMDTDGEGGIELDEFLAHMADQIELRKKARWW